MIDTYSSLFLILLRICHSEVLGLTGYSNEITYIGQQCKYLKRKKGLLSKTDKILMHGCRTKCVFCTVHVSESMIHVMAEAEVSDFKTIC